MANSVQDFLAAAVTRTAGSVEEALRRIPEDKRAWSPAGTARTAIDQAAEVAILCGATAEVLEKRAWPEHAFAEYEAQKAALAAQGIEPVVALLKENAARAAAAIRGLRDDELGVTIDTQFGPLTLQ